MPDEEIDKILRDAANQHHPPYDDTAWGKMEVLLDKHLPEKKDRKRPVIFLLIFLLVGGGIFWGIQASQNNSSKTIAEKTIAANATTAASNLPAKNNTDVVISNTTNENSTTTPQPTSLNKASNLNNVAGNNDVTNNSVFANNSNNKYVTAGRTAMKIKSAVATGDDDIAQPQKNTATKNGGDDIATVPDNKKDGVVADDNNKTVTKNEDAAIKKQDSITVEKTVNQKAPAEKNNTTTASSTKKKNNKTVADKFAITVSAGADLSYVTLSNAGKVEPIYGAGLKYNVGKHISISSGLNITKKVYTASPTQYKFVGYTNPNLIIINADCNVYEIPLTVYYNFLQAKKHGWFAGVGLSSFLMKKEYYDYEYQSTSGQPYSYDKTVSNENKHYLSVLSFSAGYQYKLSNRVSIMAEPYLKVPLSGIGLGKIKLNSTGVMVTAAINPFSKKKK